MSQTPQYSAFDSSRRSLWNILSCSDKALVQQKQWLIKMTRLINVEIQRRHAHAREARSGVVRAHAATAGLWDDVDPRWLVRFITNRCSRTDAVCSSRHLTASLCIIQALPETKKWWTRKKRKRNNSSDKCITWGSLNYRQGMSSPLKGTFPNRNQLWFSARGWLNDKKITK